MTKVLKLQRYIKAHLYAAENGVGGFSTRNLRVKLKDSSMAKAEVKEDTGFDEMLSFI